MEPARSRIEWWPVPALIIGIAGATAAVATGVLATSSYVIFMVIGLGGLGLSLGVLLAPVGTTKVLKRLQAAARRIGRLPIWKLLVLIVGVVALARLIFDF